MIEYNISELPDSFFEKPQFKSNINGIFRLKNNLSLDQISDLKIKVSSESLQYKNLLINFEGPISTRFVCHIHGDNITANIGENISGAFFIKFWDNTSLSIGSYTTANSLEAWLQRGGRLEIGNDCMFAHEVHIQCGDMHGIFDLDTGEQLNAGAPHVSIGNHVWLARGCTILKNLTIGDGAIVGIGALVTQSVNIQSLVVGAPAKELRRNVSWTRSEISSTQEMNALRSKLKNKQW